MLHHAGEAAPNTVIILESSGNYDEYNVKYHCSANEQHFERVGNA